MFSSPYIFFYHTELTLFFLLIILLKFRGGFELVREGKPPDRFDGFQAHFSSRVSPKVPELVKRFPLQLQLEEVPRQKTWPVQFQEGRPTEKNIAIYFFARDCERSVFSCTCFALSSLSVWDN